MYNVTSSYQHNKIEFSLIGVCALAVGSVIFGLIAFILFNGRGLVCECLLGKRKDIERDFEKRSLPPSYEEVNKADVLPTYEEVSISYN